MAEKDGPEERLERSVAQLRSLSGEIESCAVVSGGGALVYSSHASDVDRQRVQAMLSALAGLAGRTARADGRREAAQVSVRTGAGYLLMVRLEGGGVLAATTGTEARTGLVLYDMRNARPGIEEAVGELEESGEGAGR